MNVPREHCIRCGECCLSSSPTLHIQDLDLLKEGVIKRCDLYTVRKGELIRNNIDGRLEQASREMIKVKERLEKKGGCILYVHEERCNYSHLHRHVKAIELVGESAVESILELLRYDFHMREFLEENLHLNRDETDLLLGRPLTETIGMFGLKVVQKGEAPVEMLFWGY